MIVKPAFFSLCISSAFAFSHYESLTGIDQRVIDQFIVQNPVAAIPNPPGPLKDDSLKLVNDEEHPFMPPGPGDIRGPCPALNTLANHGYLPRTGVASPDQIITAVMEGLNLGNAFAKFLVYQAHLMNGNPLTNLLSIGMKTPETGPDPPKPALVGGLSQHGTFEGDTSMSRVDAFFGNQAVFNETRFEEFEAYCIVFGADRTYDINAAAELRNRRLQDSKATNPELVFVSPRILSAYSEAIFPLFFFVDGRKNDRKLTLEAARDFFDPNMMPKGFHRQPAAVSFPGIEPLVTEIFNKHPFTPGVNKGVGNFIEMPDTPALSDFCGIYEDIALRVVKGQYPNPTGKLKDALNINLDFLFGAVVENHNCTQVFPYYGPERDHC